MPDFLRAQPGVVEAAVQALLESRRGARKIEEAIDSIVPLLDPSSAHALELAENIRETAGKLDHWLKTLYARNAKEAFTKVGP